MGGRGGSGMSSAASTVNNLLAAGGQRWSKNGKDRIYLKNAMSRELDMSAPEAPFAMSRSIRNILSNIIDSAYYDVGSQTLVYNKTRYDWANMHVEKEFKKLKKKRL